MPETISAEPVCGFLQTLEIVKPEDKYDLKIYGQCYKIPKSGISVAVENCGNTYKYDFGKKEIILLAADGKEVYRKPVDPAVFAKSEWKWLRLAREEARLNLGLEEY